VEIFQRYKLVI